MRKVILLIILALSSVVHGQTDEKPQAVKLAEFETATNGYVKMMMDSFYVELNNDPSARGFIINYGTDREIVVRERQIRDSIKFRLFDASRVTLVRGGFHIPVKTEFWRVPAGAEEPQIDAGFELFDELGKFNEEDYKARIDMFLVDLKNNPQSIGYIVTYGSNSRILKREQLIKNYLRYRQADILQIKFIKGSYGKVLKTELWIKKPKN